MLADASTSIHFERTRSLPLVQVFRPLLFGSRPRIGLQTAEEYTFIVHQDIAIHPCRHKRITSVLSAWYPCVQHGDCYYFVVLSLLFASRIQNQSRMLFYIGINKLFEKSATKINLTAKQYLPIFVLIISNSLY